MVRILLNLSKYSTVDVHHSKSNLNLSKQNEILTVSAFLR